jgi:hypothetical protein
MREKSSPSNRFCRISAFLVREEKLYVSRHSREIASKDYLTSLLEVGISSAGGTVLRTLKCLIRIITWLELAKPNQEFCFMFQKNRIF